MVRLPETVDRLLTELRTRVRDLEQIVAEQQARIKHIEVQYAADTYKDREPPS